MLNNQHNEFESFAMRKIPLIVKNEDLFEQNDEYNDKLKILELCNLIDKWEKEVLFSQNGFYSIKGKDVESKLKEFVQELDSFISSAISTMKFDDEKSKLIAQKIKQSKIQTIKIQMQKYKQEQLKSWQLNILNDSLSSSISRAILYKTNKDVVLSSYRNAISVLQLFAEKEGWKDKTYKANLQMFNSKFYSSLISEFIQDKNSMAISYFEKYKDLLIDNDRKNLEKNIKEFKVNILAYNWAKELFSYKLSEEEQEKEINGICDEEIKPFAKKYLSEFISSEKKQNEEIEKQKNIANWQEVIKMVNEDIDRASLYIDYSLSSKSINAKKHYISQLKKNNFIVTDKKKFVDLIVELFDNFIAFKQKDIADYQAFLSSDDYNLILNFQNLSVEEFEKINIDYKYLTQKVKDINLKKPEDKYDFIKLLCSSRTEYKKNNKKDADLKARNEIIELILNRIKENKK